MLLWWRGHGAFRIQQMLMVRTQSEFNESTGIRRCLGLPAVIGLVLLHSSLRRVVPDTGRLSIEIVLANEGCLYLQGALRVDSLLPTMSPFA